MSLRSATRLLSTIGGVALLLVGGPLTGCGAVTLFAWPEFWPLLVIGGGCLLVGVCLLLLAARLPRDRAAGAGDGTTRDPRERTALRTELGWLFAAALYALVLPAAGAVYLGWVVLGGL